MVIFIYLKRKHKAEELILGLNKALMIFKRWIFRSSIFDAVVLERGVQLIGWKSQELTHDLYQRYDPEVSYEILISGTKAYSLKEFI